MKRKLGDALADDSAREALFPSKSELNNHLSEAVDVGDDDEEDFDLASPAAAEFSKSLSSGQIPRRKCPYLDTVDRQKLDFDQQKVCSQTLSHMNVYACLVCGKYFEGRGKQTPAYTHSVQCGHFVWINLTDCKTYCLPDNYEIVDTALDDVKLCLNPVFSQSDIASLNSSALLARDVYGVSFLPGFIGLNNLKSTDYLNVVLHAMSHVTPLRDFFLAQPSTVEAMRRSPLAASFGEVLRKMWSRHNFKSVISPQELMHVISTESKRRFRIGVQAEAVDLFVWLINELSNALATQDGPRKPASLNIVQECFQGEIEVKSWTRPKKGQEKTSMDVEGGEGNTNHNGEGRKPSKKGRKQAQASTLVTDPLTNELWEETITTTTFNYLCLDIPPTPLFRDSQGGLIIPQIPLFEILSKFDGKTWSEKAQVASGDVSGVIRKQYKIKKLPRFLVFHLNRFTRNNFADEKNHTIVTFPIKNLEMKDYVLEAAPLDGVASNIPETIDATMSTHQLKVFVDEFGNDAEAGELATVKELPDLVLLAKRVHSRIRNVQPKSAGGTKYNLLANICHDTLSSHDVTVGLTTETKAHKKTGTASAAASTTNNSTLLPIAAQALAGNVLSNGCYRVHIHNKATGQWFEIQDLHVTETMPQLVGLSESYMLVYERQ